MGPAPALDLQSFKGQAALGYPGLLVWSFYDPAKARPG